MYEASYRCLRASDGRSPSQEPLGLESSVGPARTSSPLTVADQDLTSPGRFVIHFKSTTILKGANQSKAKREASGSVDDEATEEEGEKHLQRRRRAASLKMGKRKR